MHRLYSILTSGLMLLGLSACSISHRSEQSGYANHFGSQAGSAQEFYREKRQNEWQSAKSDLGHNEQAELNPETAYQIRQRIELQRLEKEISNQQEKRQYYSYKPYFKNDADRIQFLKLPNREAKERWARQMGLTTEEKSFDNQTSELIDKNDIAKGMTRKAVTQSWGEPEIVEHAGNPIYGNERWRYNKLVSTEEGYKQETRIVYFEAGRVIGWETL